jgi:hypothetical protein
LFDGTERGYDCAHPATDVTKGQCVADGDEGRTTTSAVEPDTDGGGASDGEEDANGNGVQDEGERDPNRACDDSGDLTCAGSTGEDDESDPEFTSEPEAVVEQEGGFGWLGGGGCGVAGTTGGLGWGTFSALLSALALRRRRR